MRCSINILSDVVTYVRRIIKSPSNAQVTDDLIIDYINRFWINDVDARIQLFDLKTTYSFQTVPGVDRYNMPLYDLQVEQGNQGINSYPVYQGFMEPCYVDGVSVYFETQRRNFFNTFPNITQTAPVMAVGNGSPGPYTLTFPVAPFNSTPITTPVNAILRGHVDVSGIIASGANQDPIFGTDLNFNISSTSISPAVYFTTQDQFNNPLVVQDSGQFLIDGVGNKQPNYGLLMVPGTAPNGYTGFGGSYSTTNNTVNYMTGTAVVNFPAAVGQGMNINGQCLFFQSGLPRGILFENNTITLRNIPDSQYLIEMDCYLTPAAFLTTGQAVQFGYMSEYIARGAARKILSDTGDIEQFQFYEPLFREQEILVWKRSQRQFTSTRTQTIYSQGMQQGSTGYSSQGGNAF